MSMLKGKQVERRVFMQGALAFLGIASLSTLGCSQAPDFNFSELKESSQKVSSQWAPPPEVVQVGKQILSSTGRVKELIRALEAKLSAEILQSSEAIAEALRAQHLEAARSGQWVEVRGWRITSIEAAAYAMCALAAD